MQRYDDDLTNFASHGATPLPATAQQGHVPSDGAQIWYASYGAGRPIILLHGGLGNSGNWGEQIAALLGQGYRAVLIDSRGHGRSTRDARPFSYDLMAADVLAVMDALGLGRAALVGWSDGACTALALAKAQPERVAGVLFFACNVDPSGTRPFEMTPTIGRCFERHVADYAALSATPEAFEPFAEAVGLMQRTQPNYTAADLAAIATPVVVAQAEHDEFITREHAEYIARTLPNGRFVLLPGVSHFAPIQRPSQFNAALLDALEWLAAEL
ncbi:alpha/beta hydrolase [Chloroflexia bacterium SDU3-3]|nr:alpha/beta hydrolase [Chloroflexia bacterium SDU3-3]